MSYEEFSREYAALLKQLFKYDIDQAGSSVFASKLADLVEQYPDHEARLDEES